MKITLKLVIRLVNSDDFLPIDGALVMTSTQKAINKSGGFYVFTGEIRQSEKIHIKHKQYIDYTFEADCFECTVYLSPKQRLSVKTPFFIVSENTSPASDTVRVNLLNLSGDVVLSGCFLNIKGENNKIISYKNGYVTLEKVLNTSLGIGDELEIIYPV